MKKHKVLALITARGGSKGLPKKNVLDLGGKPLIAWSIECAIEAGLDRVVVSTDDEEIAEAAKKYNAEIPFMRPAELASDTASAISVIIYTLEKLSAMGNDYDLVLLLQPTSPLRAVEDITKGIELLEDDVDTVISVCEVSEPPQWMRKLDGDGVISNYFDDLKSAVNRQGLDTPYIVNGAIYLARVETLLREKTLYGGKTKALVMPRERSVDIDVKLDFMLAEALIKSKQER